MLYKGFTVDDNKVDEYVNKLECSIAEACELILEEKGQIEPSAETAKAQNVKGAKHYEKGNAKRTTKKERKVDEEKGHLLRCVKVLIEGLGGEVENLKTETELTFHLNGNRYTFKLIKHRPPK